jgi:Zn-dependent metalloprotease
VALKQISSFVLAVVLCSSFLQSAHIGRAYFRSNNLEGSEKAFSGAQARGVLRMPQTKEPNRGASIRDSRAPAADRSHFTNAFFAREIGRNNLRLSRVQNDPLARMEHRRYVQYHKGLEVLGGQLVQHLKAGRLVSTTGEYYEIGDIDTTPVFGADIARAFYEAHLAQPRSYAAGEGIGLAILPANDDDYRLVYKITLNDGPAFSMTGFVDARTGDILKEYSNIRYDGLTIGLGLGYHGEQLKLPTTYENGSYWLEDLKAARPVNLVTYDFNTFDGRSWSAASDADNLWTGDAAAVDAHAYLGWTYDYYFLAFARKGLDDQNLDLGATVHYWWGMDNAFWSGGENMIYFYDPGGLDMQMAAALDVVAHEYTHGVTQFTSGLEYYCDLNAQPGALDESFSDIIGTAVEFHFQPPGEGFDRADWVEGEDSFSVFNTANYIRSLSDPNSKTETILDATYPYPCHLSQIKIFPNTEGGDYGGVHFNSTLYSHAFYLLAEGGTNRISGLGVSGIGIEKGTKIFYRAWTFYLTPAASFLDAANSLYQSAIDLYGANSGEAAQTMNAMLAIGWIAE